MTESKPKVYVSRIIPEPGMKLLFENFAVTVNDKFRPPTREELLRDSRDSDGVLILLTELIDTEFLKNAGKQLKIVSSYSVGLDHVDVPACTEREIIVTHTPNVLTEATADLAFSLILGASRRVVEGDRYVRRGKWTEPWSPNFFVGHEVSGSTLGIVGLGRIGKAVAKRAKGFDMRVLYYDHGGAKKGKGLGLRSTALDFLLRNSDIVSVHLPLSEKTRHFFGEREFSLMKKDSIFVNTSRGGVVDQLALTKALKSGKIFAAGLDVYEKEPIESSDPLLDLENVVLSPHLGSASGKARSKMAELAARNLIDILVKKKLPKATANPEAFKKRRFRDGE